MRAMTLLFIAFILCSLFADAGARPRRQSSGHPRRKTQRLQVPAPTLPLLAESRPDPAVQPRPLLIQGQAGLLFGGRIFSLDEDPGPSSTKCYRHEFNIVDRDKPDWRGYFIRLPRCPSFGPAAAPGLRVSLAVHPLSRLRHPVLQNISLDAEAELYFWPASRVQRSESTAELGTSQWRLEVGVSGRWHPVQPPSGPALVYGLRYGALSFSIDKEHAPDLTAQSVSASIALDHGLPDVRYQYLSFLLGVSIPYLNNTRVEAALSVFLQVRTVLSQGDIADRFADYGSQLGGYGPVSSSYGFRVDATPIELRLPHAFSLSLSSYYEVFRLRFALAQNELPDQAPARVWQDSAKYLARGATDQNFGGMVGISYNY